MRLATIGDVGIDVYHNLDRVFVGGIGLNFALSARELGVEEVFVYCYLGDDAFGDFVERSLEGTGLRVRARRGRGRCSTQHLTVRPGGNREFTGYYPNVLSQWRLTPDELAELRTMDVIAAPVSDGLPAVVEQVIPLDFGGIRAIDFSEDGDWWGPDVFERFTPRLEIAFFGVHHGVPLYVPGLARRHPDKPFVVTMGPGGSVAFLGNSEIYQPPLITELVDTTGCGDAYQAGFTVSYLRHHDVARALVDGTAQAGVHMRHYGANAIRDTLEYRPA